MKGDGDRSSHSGAHDQPARKVGPDELSDLVYHLLGTIHEWSVRNNLPDLPPYVVIEQVYALLAAEYDNYRANQRSS